MYVHNINPVLFTAFGLEIRHYGVIYALAFLTVFVMLNYLAKKKEIENFGKSDVEPFLVGLIISIIIGARLFHVFVYYPNHYLRNPLEIFMIWAGGLSFHGGLVLGALWIWYFCRKKNIPFFQMTDYLVIPAAFFLALGRIANFINSELVGKVTNASWAVQFPGQEVYRHPTQIYESIKNFFLFGIIILINFGKNKLFREYVPGLITAIFIIGYGSLRFFIEFLKEGITVFIGLNLGQILSIFTVLFGVYLLYILRKTHKDVKEMEKKVKHG
jgi:phosphatidylglycerol---prolipoprotein diacylglyceryl transferase